MVTPPAGYIKNSKAWTDVSLPVWLDYIYSLAKTTLTFNFILYFHYF